MLLFLRLLLLLLLYSIISAVLYSAFSLSALTAIALSALIMTPLLLFLYRKNPFAVCRRPLTFRTVPAVFLLGAAACVFFNNIITLSGLPNLFPYYTEVAADLYAPPVPVQILCTGILIPAAEELIFRGLTFAPLKTHMKFLPAALISSLIFAVYHGNVVQGIYAFLLGVLLAWLMEKSGTVLAPYLFHAAANLTSIAITNSGFTILSNQDHMVITAAATVITAVITLCCMYWISCNTNYKEE